MKRKPSPLRKLLGYALVAGAPIFMTYIIIDAAIVGEVEVISRSSSRHDILSAADNPLAFVFYLLFLALLTAGGWWLVLYLLIRDLWPARRGGAHLHEYPLRCEKCHRQGQIKMQAVEQPLFIRCPECGWETTHVWCDRCQVGGSFVDPLEKRPDTWECPECGNSRSLPERFYDHPVSIEPEQPLSKQG